ncbi:FAD-dependent monooxygenase [Paucibacter sp. DJ2R-2]|uniref:FAD-dependent monooxygenase n=1 Tax=Paucibacter sp. DJ2R-2 TaxID=2893558 RepID=UPI0021E4C974|nr:FAD-dependent monooxygenase [Paucibacter sp. DJ2R-2]MCV2422707.1 FAD-dependent monooxygenase [Paucibacter sp. DJ4R-1]MCV2441132.1 FAD-dependent monooxygenase [Paucibacter sp. DJ2R-2]
MNHRYVYPQYEAPTSADQLHWRATGEAVRRPVVIVGAGPVGLSLALDCAARGLAVVLLDDNNSVSIGSRAVCYAKRTLEIWSRLGLAQDLVNQGVSWRLGRVFHGEGLAYEFDLLPQAGHEQPAMINLQQYHLEERLVVACMAEPLIDLRWKHKLLALADDVGEEGGPLRLRIESPEGEFELLADWLLSCDGASSDVRRMVGSEFSGKAFQDRFLIADVHIPEALGFPTERRFWFDPPFHPGQSVLLHRQSRNIWRIDFQLGWQADPEQARQPENVQRLVRAMLGPELPFELEWVSVYQFACRRIDRFRHGRVLFAGDAAHQVSPFGARGANSGVQDADNMAWKLAAVLQGRAPEALLDSYHFERAAAADDNLRQSTRSTDFITPKTATSLQLRNAVLELARREPLARPLVNSGRLSMPTAYRDSPLNTADAPGAFEAGPAPGEPVPDAPVHCAGQASWLLRELHRSGAGFVLLSFGAVAASELPAECHALVVGEDLIDAEGLLAARLDARPGSVYLIRPDQVVAARWRAFDAAAVAQALDRALARSPVASTAPAVAPASAALKREPNLQDPDGFYEHLIAAQSDLDEGQAQRFLAKLSLILANHIGDSALLREAIDLAREPETSTLTSNESAP